jgi:hypothetical protein
MKNASSEVFWPLKSSSEVSGILEDSQVPILGVWRNPNSLKDSNVSPNEK